MGFNRRKMEDQRRQVAEKEAAARRATDAQVLEDAERLVAAWNERQALRAPMIFSPTIGAAIRAGYWFLWVRCPACRSISSIDRTSRCCGNISRGRALSKPHYSSASTMRMSRTAPSPSALSASW
jgi:hypothetical protein